MPARKAFTLVEILIVVLILGILAAIVIPRVTHASAAARASVLADDVRIIRTQLGVFRAQHIGVAPGYPNCNSAAAPTEAAFLDYMTKVSTAAGATAAPGTPGFDYGPYFGEFLTNPVNGKSTIQIIGDGDAFPAAGDNSHGWIYKPATLNFRADTPGSDYKGVLYYNY